ncbi:MAG: class I SAM-dependent methyltransferase [bacterium]|jgi:demethylmenaquinone methyltransferase/2-methoxy-6-polyprenyl-1,4-benzoquinol methylase
MRGRRRIEEMNAYYDKVAPLHDKFMGYTTNEAMEELLAPIIEWVEPFVSDRDVLEIACGTGNWTQVLSRRAKAVVATDRSPAYLRIARSKTYARDNVTFLNEDAYSLEGVKGEFDTAFAADWWSHIPRSHVPVFARSMMEKLRRGSAVVLLDMLPSPGLDAMFSHYDEDGNCIHMRRFDDGTEFEVVKNFPAESELREALGEYADEMEYREHDGLRRWVLTLKVR